MAKVMLVRVADLDGLCHATNIVNKCVNVK
jgi:hypothetical protein